MTRRVRPVLIALSCLGLFACGEDSPTTPSTPGTLTIIGQTDFLTIGSTVTLQASLGSSSTIVQAEWSTQDGVIAAIDRAGKLTALASGSTTVRAAYQQQSASFALRVAPNFAGTWEGRARVTACSNPAPNVCQRDYAPGTQFVTRVTLTQNRDQVIGTLYAPYPVALPAAPPLVVDGTLSGRIEVGGGLPMTGTLSGSTPTSPTIGTINNWRTEIDLQQPILRGSYTAVVTTGTTSSISWEFVGLQRLPS